MNSPDVLVTVEQLWQPVPGGSGTYVSELVRALVARDDISVEGLAARGHARPDHGLPPDLAVRTVPLPRAGAYEVWSRWRRRTPAHLVGGAAPDVVHATTWAIPPRVAPLVVTVHDLAFLRTPAHFTRRGAQFFRRALDIVRDEADAVIVPSLTTADDCLRHGLSPERLHVVPHGVRSALVTADSVAGFREHHGLVRPYVLWCGTFEPRKNLPTLLRAFGAVTDDLDLVLVGPDGWGGASREVAEARAHLRPGRVHVLGRLSDTDLQAAYAGAALFCFPSTWEGFGMPVLEALAHGIPVVTSAGTSMAEIVDESCAVLVDPTDVDALTAGIHHAWERRDAMSRAALVHASGRSWDKAAAAHVAVYDEVAR